MRFLAYLCLLVCFTISSFAEEATRYFDIAKIEKSFPTSRISRKASRMELISIENPLQGYTILLHHHSDVASMRSIYLQTLRESSEQDLIVLFSENGYTTFLNIERGIVYGVLMEENDMISLRFQNIDIIPDILSIINNNIDSWKNFQKKS